MTQNLAYDIDSVGGAGGYGMNGFGSGNPLLWLVTLAFLRGDGFGFGGGGNEGAAGVLAGQTQAKLDCLTQGQSYLAQQAADNNISAQFNDQSRALNDLASEFRYRRPKLDEKTGSRLSLTQRSASAVDILKCVGHSESTSTKPRPLE